MAQAPSRRDGKPSKRARKPSKLRAAIRASAMFNDRLFTEIQAAAAAKRPNNLPETSKGYKLPTVFDGILTGLSTRSTELKSLETSGTLKEFIRK